MQLFKKNKITPCYIKLEVLDMASLCHDSEEDLDRALVVNISDPADPLQEINEETAEEALDLTNYKKFRPWEQ